MKKLPPSIMPLILALLFGLVVSLIPVTPVFSDNATVCQGSSTSSAASLKLAGRLITPSLILRAGGSGHPCLSGETSLSLVSLSRTIIVSPVATATQNGTALLAAMTTISSASPSVTNPWLLKLEPGQYDLGSSALTLLPYVDLEGSGEGTTLISSTVGASGLNTATLVLASHSQARFLSVANSGTHNYQLAIFTPASAPNASVVQLTATASGGSFTNAGLYNLSSGITLQNSTLTGSGGAASTAGLLNDGTAIVNNSTLTGLGAGSSINAGILNGGTSSVQNSTLTASGGSLTGGFVNSGGGSSATIHNSTLTGTGGTSINAGFLVGGGGSSATIQNSTLTASGGSSVNAGLFAGAGGATSTIQNSTLTATGTSSYGFFEGASGTNNIAASELFGTSGTASGTATCVASYNGSFQALGTDCQ